jgi:hypothetical protein
MTKTRAYSKLAKPMPAAEEASRWKLGPLSVPIDAAAFSAWLESAMPGDEIIYATGVCPPHGAAVKTLVTQAIADGLIRAHQRNHASDAKRMEYYAVRRPMAQPVPDAPAKGASIPASVRSRQEVADGLPGLAGDVFKVVKQCARHGLQLPGYSALATRLGCTRDQARYAVRQLITARLINIIDRGPRHARIAHILGSDLATRGGLIDLAERQALS